MIRASFDRPFAWADVEPLIVKAGWSAEEVGARAADPGVGTSTGACRKRVARWKTDGLTLWEADRLATALGVYPSAVWPAWDELPPVDVDQVFRTLRTRRRYQSDRKARARRNRARRVTEYRALERASERGPHTCASDGCGCPRNAAQNVLTESA